jgi:hypothetical protein
MNKTMDLVGGATTTRTAPLMGGARLRAAITTRTATAVRGAMLMLLVAALALCAANAAAQGQARKGLDVYVIDVEGGNAVLFVSPSG